MQRIERMDSMVVPRSRQSLSLRSATSKGWDLLCLTPTDGR